jgi:hypothetical protein
LFANDTNRVRRAVLCLSQDGACTNLFENFSENNLKGDLSNETADNPPLFSLVNTFKVLKFNLRNPRPLRAVKREKERSKGETSSDMSGGYTAVPGSNLSMAALERVSRLEE